jgi:hypothetical protein
MPYSKELLDKFHPKEFILQNTEMFETNRTIIHIEGELPCSCQICNTTDNVCEVSYQRIFDGQLKRFKVVMCGECLKDPDWIEFMEDCKVTNIKTL